jgi:hypothetical protein
VEAKDPKTISSNTLNVVGSIIIVVDVKPYKQLATKALKLLDHIQQQLTWLIQGQRNF